MNKNFEIDHRLLHAKNLLKKYQNKQVAASENCNENNFKFNQEFVTEGPSFVSNLINSDNTTAKSSSLDANDKTLQNHNNEHEILNNNVQDEIICLKKLLQEKEQFLSETQSKLRELHSHYTELYTAYNTVVKLLEPNDDVSQNLSKISKLQTALAVALEEKNILQSELQNLKENVQDDKNNNPQSSQVLSIKTETEINQLKEEQKRLLETVANQCTTIEEHRKNSSNLEAKILLINQDRNEAQARLKFLFEEKVELEKKTKELENILNMKEIYIRQLTRVTETDPLKDQLAIQTLDDEKKQFQEEVEIKKLEINDLKKQLESTRSQYDSCIAEMSQQISILEEKISSLTLEKNEIDSIKIYQEEQLRLMKETLKTYSDSQTQINSTQIIEETINFNEHASLLNNYSLLQEDFLRCRNKVQDLEKTIEQKDAQFELLQYELIDAQKKIVTLENSYQLQNSLNMDVKTLSEQLQNEKATVSRAVAQNVELKKQLQELQDKIVQVTNECMAKEDERLLAVANVENLKKKLEITYETNLNYKTDDKQDCSDNTNINKQNNFLNNIVKESENLKITENTQMNQTKQEDKIENNNQKKNLCQKVAINSNKEKNFLDKASTFDYPITPPSTPVDISKNNQNQLIITNSHVEEKLKIFINQQNNCVEKIQELEKRLEVVLEENENFRFNNKKLEYWLTSLEAENENIGQYIAIYRYLRSNIQKKMLEKDLILKKVQQDNKMMANQLTRLYNAIVNFLNQYNKNFLLKNENTENTLLKNNEKNAVNNVESYVHKNCKISSVLDNWQETNFDPNVNIELHTLFEIIKEIKTKSDESLKCKINDANENYCKSFSTSDCLGCVECRGKLFTL